MICGKGSFPTTVLGVKSILTIFLLCWKKNRADKWVCEKISENTKSREGTGKKI
jgi:hypothetical protein